MGWNHPDISLEEMMKLIKGFLDILILASGYQSSGLLAHWDSDNIKRAFQWALFFENVFRRLSSLDVYQESIEELDTALFEMTSHPSFPQGLAHLSSATLRRARDVTPTMETEKCGSDNFTKLAVQELFRRQFSVSCISSIEEGVDILSNAVRYNSWTESDCSLFREQTNRENLPALVRSECHMFVHVYAGLVLALMLVICFWPSCHYAHLHVANGSYASFGDRGSRVVLNVGVYSSYVCRNLSYELLLLGCIASRWNSVIEHLMLVSYDSVTISKQYHVLSNSVFGISQSFHQNEEIIKSKEGGILDYLMGLLGGQLHLLWESSPSLAAVSLPSWSTLFRLYLSEIETQFKGNPSTMRFGICKSNFNCSL
ncbi:hypothetical protein CRYUN_Cryun14cG0118200 [Craigia yunnanensis]